jgi:hypothetical protein
MLADIAVAARPTEDVARPLRTARQAGRVRRQAPAAQAAAGLEAVQEVERFWRA